MYLRNAFITLTVFYHSTMLTMQALQIKQEQISEEQLRKAATTPKSTPIKPLTDDDFHLFKSKSYFINKPFFYFKDRTQKASTWDERAKIALELIQQVENDMRPFLKKDAELLKRKDDTERKKNGQHIFNFEVAKQVYAYYALKNFNKQHDNQHFYDKLKTVDQDAEDIIEYMQNMPWNYK